MDRSLKFMICAIAGCAAAIAPAQAQDRTDPRIAAPQLQASSTDTAVPQLPAGARPITARPARVIRRAPAPPAQPVTRTVIEERTFDFDRLLEEEPLMLPSVREGLRLQRPVPQPAPGG